MEQHESFARLMARKKKLAKAGEGTSSSVPPTGSAATVPPHSVGALLKSTNIQETPIEVKPDAPEVTKGKIKRKTQEKTSSPPKKWKMGVPPLVGPLDPNVQVADRIQFNLTRDQRKPFKGMTPSESLNIAYELIARASVCLNYIAGTTKPLLVAKLEAATKNLEDVKRDNVALTLRIEEMTKAAEDPRVKAENQLKES